MAAYNTSHDAVSAWSFVSLSIGLAVVSRGAVKLCQRRRGRLLIFRGGSWGRV